MRVDIAAEQERLEKEQAGRPHSGSAAEPRQDIFSYERLDREKEKRASKDRKGERSHTGQWGCQTTNFAGGAGQLQSIKPPDMSLPDLAFSGWPHGTGLAVSYRGPVMKSISLKSSPHVGYRSITAA